MDIAIKASTRHNTTIAGIYCKTPLSLRKKHSISFHEKISKNYLFDLEKLRTFFSFLTINKFTLSYSVLVFWPFLVEGQK